MKSVANVCWIWWSKTSMFFSVIELRVVYFSVLIMYTNMKRNVQQTRSTRHGGLSCSKHVPQISPPLSVVKHNPRGVRFSPSPGKSEVPPSLSARVPASRPAIWSCEYVTFTIRANYVNIRRIVGILLVQFEKGHLGVLYTDFIAFSGIFILL